MILEEDDEPREIIPTPIPSPSHPTLQLITQRAAQRSMPGARKDEFKLGLVVEGGGMRGIVSGAMCLALNALGLRNCFDAVYGASAGAINLSYFLSGQDFGLKIYTEDLNDSRFLNYARTFRGKPIMDLGYLIDHVMQQVKPLDFQAVMDSPIPLKVVASSLDKLRPVLLEGWHSRADIVEALKASSWIPRIAGPPRVFRGHSLVDAAVFEPVPVMSAINDGCTHVLVLCTRPAKRRKGTWRRLVRGHMTIIVKNTVLDAPYLRAAWKSEMSSDKVLDNVDDELLETLCQPEESRKRLGGFVLPCFPSNVAGCIPVTTNVRVLKAAEMQGWKAVASLLAAEHVLPHLNQSLLGSYGPSHDVSDLYIDELLS